MLILDLKMPRMDGMEVLRNIKELKKDLITIVITGYGAVDTAKEAIKLGCFDYITKPLNIEDVHNVIERAFEMHRSAEKKKRLQEQIQTAKKLMAEAAKKKAEEIASLNDDLLTTTLELRQSNEELTALKAELEQKVDERTAELQKVKHELEQRDIGLEKLNRAVASKELKIEELKKRIKELENHLKAKGN